MSFDLTEGVEFSHEATMLLIEGIKKRYQELNSNNRARPQVYRDLHEELTLHGYNFSVERIRRKWNNLLGTYKRVKKEFSPHKPPWEYYQVHTEHLSVCVIKSINPVFSLQYSIVKMCILLTTIISGTE